MFTVESQNFQGPLDKLLELVQKEKLDINQVSLAKVTDAFLKYITKLEQGGEMSNRTLADFLIIVSKLLLIKSKMLVPDLVFEKDEEEEIHDLETQLKIYKRIKEAEKNIEQNWHEKSVMANREFFAGNEIIFRPGNVTIKHLKRSLIEIIEEIKKFKPTEKIKREIINLKDKIKDIMERIENNPIDFKNFYQSNNKGEIIVLFLAILHLFRKEKINLEQKERFGEITVKKSSNLN